MTDLSLTWAVRGGWAAVRLADQHGEIQVAASRTSPAPEDFLGAVTRVVRGDAEARADFEADPWLHKWHFHRTDGEVGIWIVTGATAWSTTAPVGTLAGAAVRCFDAITDQDEYEREWGSPFPRLELEDLRAAWRTCEASAR